MASPASATPISVVNASFETLTSSGLNFGPYSANVGIPGWLASSPDSGQLISLSFIGSNDDGIYNAWSNRLGTFSQTVGATAQAGETYTLQVDMGTRLDAPNGGSIALVVNGNTVLGTGPALQVGDWVTYTASYTASQADAGSLISILLQSGSSPNQQAQWDNVRLTSNDTTVPEPATWTMLLLGFLGVGFMIRSARRKDAVAGA